MNHYKVIAPSIYPNELWSEVEVLGAVGLLWQRVETLKHAPISYLIERISPFIQHGQFALFIEKQRACGFISWAYFNDKAENEYIQRQGQALSKNKYKSGQKLWIIDWISPDGLSKELKQFVLNELFPYDCMHSLYHRGDEKGLKVMSFRGSKISADEFKRWKSIHSLTV